MRARHEVAIVDGSTNEALTYAELHANTYRFAHALRKQFGVGSDDTVAIYAPNHKHYFSVFQGIGLTGGRSTPINPLYKEDEVSFQCRMTHAKAIVAHPICMGVAQVVAAQLGIPVISFENCAGTTPLTSLLHPVGSEGSGSPGPGGGSDGGVDRTLIESFKGIDPASIMTIPFSSGTTGTPKGVMLTHDNLVANVLQSIPQEVGRLSRNHPDNAGERGALVVPVPFYHIFGMITGMCAPLRVGGKMVFLPSFDLQQFLQLVQDHRVTKVRTPTHTSTHANTLICDKRALQCVLVPCVHIALLRYTLTRQRYLHFSCIPTSSILPPGNLPQGIRGAAHRPRPSQAPHGGRLRHLITQDHHVRRGPTEGGTPDGVCAATERLREAGVGYD